MQNFDPAVLQKDLQTGLNKIVAFVDRIESIESTLEGFVNTLAPIVQIFAPFLPAPIGSAIEELPLIQQQIAAVKNFVNNELPLVQQMIGVGGVGATQTAGVTLPPDEIKSVNAAAIGTFDPQHPPKPSTPPPHGMEWLLTDGAWALAQIPPKE